MTTLGVPLPQAQGRPASADPTALAPSRPARGRRLLGLSASILLSLLLHALLAVGFFVYWLLTHEPPEEREGITVLSGVIAPVVEEDRPEDSEPLEPAPEDPLLETLPEIEIPADPLPPMDPEFAPLDAAELEPVDSPSPISLRSFKRQRPAPIVPPIEPSPETPAPAAPPVVAPRQPAPTPPAVARPRTPLRVTHEPDIRNYYPEEARRRGVTGQVVVGFEVDAQGVVRRAWVHKSSGSVLLDEAAVRMLYDSRYSATGAPRKAGRLVRFSLR